MVVSAPFAETLRTVELIKAIGRTRFIDVPDGEPPELAYTITSVDTSCTPSAIAVDASGTQRDDE
jgi:hypothetical protein